MNINAIQRHTHKYCWVVRIRNTSETALRPKYAAFFFFKYEEKKNSGGGHETTFYLRVA